MREVVEQMQARMRETGSAVAYCTGGHGHTWVNAETVEGDSHGACPGPVLVMEPNPDVMLETVAGGVKREAPPCGRCGGPTTLLFDDDGPKVLVDELAAPERMVEEWSFTLQDADAVGDPMTVCLRCLAGALAAPTSFALLEVRGRRVPWRNLNPG